MALEVQKWYITANAYKDKSEIKFCLRWEIDGGLKLGVASYHSFQNLLLSRLLIKA
jgi:hypothetical protein